jgi:hypothetical protein
MLVTVYQSQWMTETPLDAIRTDPTRMAQGMTGIGFLGADLQGGLEASETRTVAPRSTHAYVVYQAEREGDRAGPVEADDALYLPFDLRMLPGRWVMAAASLRFQ